MRPAVVFASIALVLGCRGQRSTAGDAAVGEGPSQPPTATGGGAPDERVHSSTSALDVLTAAWCDRARICGGEATCKQDASRELGAELERCDQGVRGAGLAQCAQAVRATPCAWAVASPEPCAAALLCAQR
ncbi:MAG: hypothetical protein HYV09_32195 [Deltaproteobacteria bacterium]|nr:hypothetical protein [Deltaproteobacteria bacterium]